MLAFSLTLAACLMLCNAQTVPRSGYPAPSYETPQYWVNLGREDILTARNLADNLQRGQAKNLVFFLGDGLGMTTHLAGRIYKGQLQNRSGEETKLVYETFPHIGLAKTYDITFQTPDSAATATAFASGVKTNDGVVGVNQYVMMSNCSTYDSSKNLYSFMHYAKIAGKSVGLVATPRITHATPASMYAHTPDRDWESDANLPASVDPTKCRDIAYQLVENAADFNVIFGGGRQNFLPSNFTTIDYSNKSANASGVRRDGVNLINRWRDYQTARYRRFTYAESKSDFDAIDPAKVDYVMGLFSLSHMRYQLNNELDQTYREPSLTEMVEKAIRLLSRNPNGYVLFVEAGRIDHGHHTNNAKLALYDVVELDRAVSKALSLTNRADTLMLVTGDHSHVFTVGGWGQRGQPLFEKLYYATDRGYNSDREAVAGDGMPYTVLNYADGPSAAVLNQRNNLTGVDTTTPSFRFPSLYKISDESHGAEDVPVYAIGPSAHLIHTTHEQSYISHVIMYALCIGPEANTWCASRDVPTTPPPIPKDAERLFPTGLIGWVLLLFTWLGIPLITG